ncbi:unnamed protein product, partial [Rotaria magnacalcarata]
MSLLEMASNSGLLSTICTMYFSQTDGSRLPTRR